jgi:hypothetical protein
MTRSFDLPPVIAELVLARNRVLDHYKSAALTFTLDGNLIGDIGEAVAAALFGIKLSVRNGTGIDGHAPDGRSVQIKATGTGGGPAFRMVDTRADHLQFLEFDLANLKGSTNVALRRGRLGKPIFLSLTNRGCLYSPRSVP